MKNTCLFYALRQSYLLRKARFHYQVKLFYGFSCDSLALHVYIYLPDKNLSFSFCPLPSRYGKRKDNLLFAFCRVVRFLFPFSGYVKCKYGDYYRPEYYSSDFHCKSIVLWRY